MSFIAYENPQLRERMKNKLLIKFLLRNKYLVFSISIIWHDTMTFQIL